MDHQITQRYWRAHTKAAAKAVDMPGWMLRRCVTHAMRIALTPACMTSVAMHETAWGSTDGYVDEILRRRDLVARTRPLAFGTGPA